MRRATIGTRDLYLALKLLAFVLPSWVVPVDRLGSLARGYRRWKRRSGGTAAAAIERMLGPLGAMRSGPEIFDAWQDHALEAGLQVLALYRPRRRWQPTIEWRGLENLKAALDNGRGAILWMSDFVYATLVAKIAFAQAGFPLIQLYRPDHGFSVTPFGIRHLNPLWTGIEDRYLAARVLIAGSDTRPALDELRAWLSRNRVVSILVSETARRTRDVEFLRGRLRVASGPPHLARTTGAPLLPVFAARNESGAYAITLGSPLALDGPDELDYAPAMSAYARMLEPFVLAHPEQWNGWLAIGRMIDRGTMVMP